MANSYAEPRGSAGSDFFVVLGQGREIEARYAVIGRVRAGMSTVKRIGSLGTDTETPAQVVKIESIRIRREAPA